VPDRLGGEELSVPFSAAQRLSDPDVAALLRTPRLRKESFARAITALDQLPPDVAGTLLLEVVTPTGTEGWTVGFTPTGVAQVPGAEPQAVVRVGLEDLLHLVAGKADGALLYLSGRVAVSGDEQLVLDVGRALRPPGSDRAAIDPAALDPLAVSAAIGEADLAHLAAVMSGGLRDLVISEVFRRLPEFLIAERAERARVAVAFEIERAADEDADRYVVRIDHGTCSVEADAPPDTPVDATLVLAGHEFLRLALGHLNPVRGVMSGQIRVRGHVIKALAFNSVIHIPGS
jgi:putative sterol carrier protein